MPTVERAWLFVEQTGAIGRRDGGVCRDGAANQRWERGERGGEIRNPAGDGRSGTTRFVHVTSLARTTGRYQ